jgi:hypothetical protein
MIRKKVKAFIYDFVNGLHSGIPICCVWNYSKLFGVVNKAVFLMGEYGVDFYSDNKIKHIGYVPCARCYKKNHFIRIKYNGKVLRYLILKKGT